MSPVVVTYQDGKWISYNIPTLPFSGSTSASQVMPYDDLAQDLALFDEQLSTSIETGAIHDALDDLVLSASGISILDSPYSPTWSGLHFKAPSADVLYSKLSEVDTSISDAASPHSITGSRHTFGGTSSKVLRQDGSWLTLLNGPTITGSLIPYGSTSGKACQGNDPRLSDSRTPLTHGNEAHSESFVTMEEVLAEPSISSALVAIRPPCDITISRTTGGAISQLDFQDGRQYTISRDAYGISSVELVGQTTWTIQRDGDGVITGIAVT